MLARDKVCVIKWVNQEGTRVEESISRWQPCPLPFSPLKPAEAWGEAGRSEPSLPLRSRKAGPLCCKGSSGGCCLGMAKAKGVWAGLLCWPAWKLIVGSFGPALAQARVVLVRELVSFSYLQNGEASMYQCSTGAVCDCCCASTSGNLAGAWLSLTSDNEKQGWSC